MNKIRIKGSASLNWAHELVEDKDSGNFYLRVYPKLSNIRVYRDKSFARQLAQGIIQEIKSSKQTGNVKVK